MPDPKKFNLDYRPISYWDEHECPFARIKGELRKQYVLSTAERGAIDGIDPKYLGDTIPDDVRTYLKTNNPRKASGEYLPDYINEEVEIARVMLDRSDKCAIDIISIRAHKTVDGIIYQAVDELLTSYTTEPLSSKVPLSLRELVNLINRATKVDDSIRGLLSILLNRAEKASDPELPFYSLRVTSEYYPELRDWYQAEIIDRVARNQAERHTNRIADIRTIANANPDQRDDNGYCALHWAARYGDAAWALQLIEHGATVDLRTPVRDEDSGCVTPLHVASFWGHLNVMQVLLDHGADIEATDVLGSTPLLKSCCRFSRTIKYLIDRGARPDVATNLGSTALIGACLLGNSAAAAFLLEHKVNVNNKIADGFTPLHLATTPSLVRLLLDRGADVTARDDDGSTPLHSVVWNSYSRLSYYDITPERPGEARYAPVYRLLPEEKKQKITMLVEAGADVNAFDRNGETPLHISNTRVDVEQLIDSGAEVTSRNRSRQSPLHRTIESNCTGAAIAIIECSDDLTEQCGRGLTPLHYAAGMNNLCLVQALLARRVNPEITDRYGRTPASIALDQANDEIHLLITHTEMHYQKEPTPADLLEDKIVTEILARNPEASEEELREEYRAV